MQRQKDIQRRQQQKMKRYKIKTVATAWWNPKQQNEKSNFMFWRFSPFSWWTIRIWYEAPIQAMRPSIKKYNKKIYLLDPAERPSCLLRYNWSTNFVSEGFQGTYSLQYITTTTELKETRKWDKKGKNEKVELKKPRRDTTKTSRANGSSPVFSLSQSLWFVWCI